MRFDVEDAFFKKAFREEQENWDKLFNASALLYNFCSPLRKPLFNCQGAYKSYYNLSQCDCGVVLFRNVTFFYNLKTFNLMYLFFLILSGSSVMATVHESRASFISIRPSFLLKTHKSKRIDSNIIIIDSTRYNILYSFSFPSVNGPHIPSTNFFVWKSLIAASVLGP